MILSKEQIEKILLKTTDEKGTKIVENFLNNLKPYLDSDDVKNVYDIIYEKILNEHETALKINSKYKLHIYNIQVYDYLCNHIQQNNNILELGCGSGNLLMALAWQYNNVGEYIGVDFNPNVIAHATEQVKNDGLNCKFICCDANEFNSTQKFDFIILSDVIEHLSDRELTRLVNNCSKFLSKNGSLVMHTPNGLNINCQTDSTFLTNIYYRVYSNITGYKFKKSCKQLYYEQVHINVKSYRKWKKLFNDLGYSLKVKYDKECGENNLLFKTVQNILHLQGNMLLIANKN